MKARLFSHATLFQCASLALLACLFWALRGECLQADAADSMCLSGATPFISFIKDTLIGARAPWWLYDHYKYTIYGCMALLGLALIVLLLLKRCPLWGALYLIAICVCALGELKSLYEQPSYFLALYVCGMTIAAVAFFLLARVNKNEIGHGVAGLEAQKAPPRWYEIGAFALLFGAIAITRFYAINRIPGHWDAEMCGHRPVVASWNLMLQQELGTFTQQASGLSWLLAHRFFSRYDDPLFFWLDQRFIGAAISILNCWVVYFFLRYLGGTFAALMATAVFAFGPLEIEWARGATLHNLPLLVGLLLTWVSFKAFYERTWRSFLLLALLIIASKFVYPSSRLVALGPCLGLLGLVFTHRPEWHGHKRKLILIVFGGALYALSRSIAAWMNGADFRFILPFDQIQPITGQGNFAHTALGMAKSFINAVPEIFSNPRAFGHYTLHTTLHPPRAMPSIATIFAGLALVRMVFAIRTPGALIWLGVLVGGLIPTLMTELADRRFGFTLIALPLLAVMELTWFCNRFLAPRLPITTRVVKVSIFSLCTTLLLTSQITVMFSRPPGRPHQLNLIEAARPLVKPDTLVVHLDGANPCPLFYGIYDILKDSHGSIGYASSLDFRGGPTEAINQPRVSVDTWQYRHTALAEQSALMKSRREWPRLLFVFYPDESTIPWQQMLKQRYPRGEGREVMAPNPSKGAGKIYAFETPWEP